MHPGGLNRLTLLSGLLLIFALFWGDATAAFAKTSPSRQNQGAKAQIQAVTAARAAVGTRSLTHKDERCSVMVNYPQVGNSKIDAELDYWAGKTVSTFVSGVSSLGPKGETRFSMLVDYEFSESSDNFLSIIFRINTETGGPHPDPGMVAFTYDLSDGRKLGLQDIFSDTAGLLEFLSAYSYETLLDELGPAHEKGIKQGTGRDFVNFSLFALRPDGLVFYFPPYQVADYALGEQQVVVSLDKLERFKPRPGVWRNKSTFNSGQVRLGMLDCQPQ